MYDIQWCRTHSTELFWQLLLLSTYHNLLNLRFDITLFKKRSNKLKYIDHLHDWKYFDIYIKYSYLLRLQIIHRKDNYLLFNWIAVSAPDWCCDRMYWSHISVAADPIHFTLTIQEDTYTQGENELSKQGHGARNKAKQNHGHVLWAIADNICPRLCFALFLASGFSLVLMKTYSDSALGANSKDMGKIDRWQTRTKLNIEGQSVTKPETLLQISLVGNVNLIIGLSTATSSI